MYGIKQQRGMTGLGVLAIAILVIFAGYLCLKLAPPYYQNYLVVSTLKTIVKEYEGEPTVNFQQFKRDITRQFDDRLHINSVYDVKKEHLTMRQVKNTVEISLDYKIQVHIVGNMDVLLHFKDRVKAKK